ncbi:hypothetical protein D9M68_837420 [compost metagenome]
MGGRVAAHQHGAFARQVQVFDDGQGQVGDLVGHDAPGQAAAADVGQERLDAGEQLAVHGGAGRVVFQELQSGGFVVGVARPQAERHAQQAAGALGGHRAQRLVGHRFQALAGALAVGRGGQVGGRIGQRAVEVEQDQGAHLRVAIR